jgi:hypothetical protein
MQPVFAAERRKKGRAGFKEGYGFAEGKEVA